MDDNDKKDNRENRVIDYTDWFFKHKAWDACLSEILTIYNSFIDNDKKPADKLTDFELFQQFIEYAEEEINYLSIYLAVSKEVLNFLKSQKIDYLDDV